MELARITNTRAYILATTQASPTALVHWQLSFTADSGATWTSRLVPCGGPFALGAEVAASSTDDLWLLCGSQASAGEQSKQLFRSSDGGATWSLVAAAVLGAPAQASVPPNPLPLAGYIAPFTIGHRNLAVASPETAWLFPSRAVLYITSDGGASWDQVPELAAAGFASGGQGNITFLSPTRRVDLRLRRRALADDGRGPLASPRHEPDACGPACPSGRRAHRVLCCAALGRPRARGDVRLRRVERSAFVRREPGPHQRIPGCAGDGPLQRSHPGHEHGWANVRSPGFSERRAVEFVWSASRDGGAERCCPARPDEPGAREARCRRSRHRATGGDRHASRDGDIVPDVCVVHREPAGIRGLHGVRRPPGRLLGVVHNARSCPASTDSQQAAK